MPLQNGNMEVKGILSKVVTAEGTVEEFKVGESVNLFLIWLIYVMKKIFIDYKLI